MAGFTIHVKFTGICAFVEHQQGATVLLPNATSIMSVNAGGEHVHVPGHIAFLEFNPTQSGLNTTTVDVELFRYFDGGGIPQVVVALADPPAGFEVTFAADDEDPTHFPSDPPRLDWSHLIDMSRVTGPGYPIDSSLVSRFDPRADRIATRLSIDYGSVLPIPAPFVNASFLPPPDPPYSDSFPQEVEWKFDFDDDVCYLEARPFGSEQSQPGDKLLKFDGSNGATDFWITIGNAPIEDILRRGTGSSDVVDQHFAHYYDLLAATPAVIRLPHRTSEKRHGTRSGASNCPPALIPLR